MYKVKINDHINIQSLLPECKEHICKNILPGLSRLVQQKEKLERSTLLPILHLGATCKEMNKRVNGCLKDFFKSYLQMVWNEESRVKGREFRYFKHEDEVTNSPDEYATLLMLSFQCSESLNTFQRVWYWPILIDQLVSHNLTSQIVIDFFKTHLTLTPILFIENSIKFYLDDGSPYHFANLARVFSSTILVQDNTMKCNIKETKLYINSQSLESIITTIINCLNRNGSRKIPEVVKLFSLLINNNIISINDNRLDLIIKNVIDSPASTERTHNLSSLVQSSVMTKERADKILSSIFARSLEDGFSFINDLIEKKFFTTDSKFENLILIEKVMELLKGDDDQKQCGEKILEKMSLAGMDFGVEINLRLLYSRIINTFSGFFSI